MRISRKNLSSVRETAGWYFDRRLVNRDVTELENQDSSKKKIPIKDAYYQLINNNVLSLKHMESEEAGAIEQQIHQKFLSSREQIMKELESQLYNPNAPSMAELPEDQKAYMQYIYSYLSDSTVGIIQRTRSTAPARKRRTGKMKPSVSGIIFTAVFPITGSIRRSWRRPADIPVRMTATMPLYGIFWTI